MRGRDQADGLPLLADKVHSKKILADKDRLDHL